MPSPAAARRTLLRRQSAAPAGAPRVLCLALRQAFAGTVLSLLWPMAQANPQGPAVVHGQAGFQTQGRNLTVTNSAGAVIDWRSFSIAPGERTHFQQPHSASSVLNRVVTAQPSQLFGTLSSNGKVVLVNQAGIAVGAGAVVDTAGFTASTLSIANEDWMAGRLRFFAQGGAGALQVDGTVRSRNGDIVLLAPKVEVGPQALAQAQDGSVVLAAGQKAEITGRGLEGIQFEVKAGGQALNLGRLEGDAVGVFAGTLKHSGAVVARTARAEGGKVRLLADSIVLTPASRVDATGSGQGAGGHVVLFADGDAKVEGSIRAGGGPDGGAGGFIETSARKAIQITRAPEAGVGGTWLLDPLNISVVGGGAVSNNSGPPAFTPGGGSSTVGADLIVSQLNAGTHVVLDTNVAGADAGTIDVLAPIVKTAANAASLTLNANTTIAIGAAIDTTAGGLTLNAPGGTTVNADISTQALNTPHAFHLQSGTVTVKGTSNVAHWSQTGGTLTGAGTLNVTGAFALSGPGAMTGTGSTVLGPSVNYDASGRTIDRSLEVGGATTLNAGSTLTINPGKTLTPAGGMTASTAPFANSAVVGGGTLSIPAGATFTFTSNDTRELYFSNVTVDNAGNFRLNGTYNPGTVAFDAGAVLNNLPSGQIDFARAGNQITTTAGTGTLNNSGTITSSGGHAASLGLTHVHFNSGTVLAGGAGSVQRSGASTSYNGSGITVDTLLNMTAGSQTFADGLSVGGAGSVQHDGASVTVNNVTFNVPYTLTPNDTLTIPAGKTMTANGGMTGQTAAFANSLVQGGGSLSIPAGKTFTFSSNDTRELFFSNVTVDNAGTFQLNGTYNPGTVAFDAGAVLNNLPGGQIVFAQAGNQITTTAGTGTLNNSGTITSTGGHGIQLGLTNAVFNGGSQLGGGTVTRGGASTTFNGAVTVDSPFVMAAGSQVFSDGAAIAGSGGISLDGASLTANNVTLNVPFTLTAGDTLNIASGKTMTVAGGMTAHTAPFASATIQGGGTLAVPAGKTFQFVTNDTQVLHLSNVTVENAGTFDLAGTYNPHTLAVNDGATLNNLAGGQLRFTQAGGTITTTSGTGTVSNAGTITAAPGVAVSLGASTLSNLAGGQVVVPAGGAGVIASAIGNSGTIQLDAGASLSLTGSYTDTATGVLALGAGATLTPPSGMLPLAAGTLRGNGTVSGTVHNTGGVVTPGASPGSLTISGNYTQGAAGTLQIELSGLTPGTGFDVLTVGNIATLDGTVSFLAPGPFAPAIADTFQFLNATSVAGTFAATTLPPGYVGTVHYAPDHAMLLVSATTPPAAPAPPAAAPPAADPPATPPAAPTAAPTAPPAAAPPPAPTAAPTAPPTAAPTPAPTAPPAPAPAAAPSPAADLAAAKQETNNQVVAFAALFVATANDQNRERGPGKDDIVLTDTQCKAP